VKFLSVPTSCYDPSYLGETTDETTYTLARLKEIAGDLAEGHKRFVAYLVEAGLIRQLCEAQNAVKWADHLVIIYRSDSFSRKSVKRKAHTGSPLPRTTGLGPPPSA
jgi:hypothetical protein